MYLTIYAVIFGLTLFFVFATFMSSSVLAATLAVLAVLVVIFIVKRNMDLRKQTGSTKREKMHLHITNVDVGGVFKLSNVNGEDLELKVMKRHLYQEGDFFWYELECDNGGEDKVWVEVEDDDQTIVTVVTRKFAFANLTGITPALLEKFDDNENGSIPFDGKTYIYNESDEAVFYRNCDDKNPQKVYYWDFKSGDEYLTVERWGHDEYQCFISQAMKPSQITVYSNTEEG